jgi:hypothetical protein
MDNKTVNFREVKIRLWLKKAWERIKKAINDFAAFVKENPITVSLIFGVVTEILRFSRKVYTYYEEDKRQNRKFYDRRKDQWNKTTRKLRSWELDELEARYACGESKRDILRDLGVLK